MKIVLIALLAMQPGVGPTVAQPGPGATYQSAKGLPALQKCLTDKLARIGDVTDVTIDGVTTLMVRESSADQAMVIDLAPPSVTVTTKFLYGTRKLVEACI